MPTPPPNHQFFFSPKLMQTILGTGYGRLPWDPEVPEDSRPLEQVKDDFPLIAFRTWKIMHPGYLADANGFALWEPRQRIEATCRAMKHHDAPQEKCSCGIYALKTMEQLDQYLRTISLGHGATHVLGQVWLWGTVIECENGYRAQYAYPKNITLRVEQNGIFDSRSRGLEWANKMAPVMSRRYGVPVDVVDREAEPYEPIPSWILGQSPIAALYAPFQRHQTPTFEKCVPPDSVSLIKEPTDNQVKEYSGTSIPAEGSAKGLISQAEIDEVIDDIVGTSSMWIKPV